MAASSTSLASLLVPALALAACSEAPSAADGGDLGVVMRAVAAGRTPGGAPETADVTGSAVAVTAAWAHVERIDFSLPDGITCADLDPATLVDGVVCDGDDTLRVVDERTFDLVTGVAEPALDGVVVPPLAYRRVDVRLAEGPAGSTFVAELSVEGAPVSVDLRFSEDARFEGDGALALTDAAAALLALDADAWFASLDLGACAGAGGVVDEDADDACDLENELEDAVKESGRLTGDGSDAR